MLDYNYMNVLIGDDYFFSINEDNLSISICIEDERLFNSGKEFNLLYSSRKITSFSLGDNLFNFLSISNDDLDLIKRTAEIAKWDYMHPEDETSRFLSSLDCIYLYLLFYSHNRDKLGMEYRSRLDILSKEFEFALNFCCNDECEPNFKNLSCLQRYYIYSQLYVDNMFTAGRYLTQNRYLFMESSMQLTVLDTVPRMNVETYYHGLNENGFEPITQKPIIPKSVIDSVQDAHISLSFRFHYATLEEYLMEELFSLIKLNIKVKKCKNCGKYFILKGDYATDYCDRIPEGEKNTCKRIASIKVRKGKVKANPILSEFQKAYKRNYARQSNKKITPVEFENWVNEATARRDKAMRKYEQQPNEKIVQDFKKYLGNK